MLDLINGDVLETLKKLPSEIVQCCVTSPPYWGLRNYGVDGQWGNEQTLDEYLQRMLDCFTEVQRVLKKDGTLWLNIGDSYAGGGRGCDTPKQKSNRGTREMPKSIVPLGCKPKDLIGIPWRLALAMQASGWWIRQENTWCKTACMPESVRDRPTCATEKIFLMTRSSSYYYDADAVREKMAYSTLNDSRLANPDYAAKRSARGFPGQAQHGSGLLKPKGEKQRGHSRRHNGFNERWDHMTKEEQQANGRNLRNYWLLNPEPFPEAHFATFPTEIPKRAILAGTKPGDLVLDPFAGSGTTGKVALELGRRAMLIELNPAYCNLIRKRCMVTPGLPLATITK